MIPPDPDLYRQAPELLITEVRNMALLPSCTMLVMDVSESMVEEIEQAREGLRYYVRLFRPIDRGGIVQFSSRVVVFQPMTNDTSLLIEKINSATVGGGTAIYDALMTAIDGIRGDMGERGRRSIIVYTDGEDRSSKITPQAVIDSARVYNLPIYTIALGNMTQEDVLKLIAEQTNGIFFKAATAEEMKSIYGKLSQLKQNYYVMAQASPDPNFNNTWRQVDITVTLPDQQGRGWGRYFVSGPPALSGTDLALNLISRTDTSVVAAGNSINAVVPGDTFEYVLSLKNLGPHIADTVRLVHHLPDSVRYITATTPPQFIAKDTLSWELINIIPNQEVNISVLVQLDNEIAAELSELISKASLYSDNDTTLTNNYDADTVRVLFQAPPTKINYDLSITIYDSVATARSDLNTRHLISTQKLPRIEPGQVVQIALEWRTRRHGLHQIGAEIADPGRIVNRYCEAFYTISKGVFSTKDTVMVQKNFHIIYDLPYVGKIFFDSSRAEVKEHFLRNWVIEPPLAVFARRLQENPRIQIKLQGTIDPNSNEQEILLADQRAAAVRDSLHRLGINLDQMEIVPGIQWPPRQINRITTDTQWILEEQRKVDITTGEVFEESLFQPLQTTFIARTNLPITFHSNILGAVLFQQGAIKLISYDNADSLNIDENILICFQGHGCAIGSEQINTVLSKQRASTFMEKFLQDIKKNHPDFNEDVRHRTLPSQGLGESEPLAFRTLEGKSIFLGDNSTPLGRQLNRRVMVYLSPR